MQHQGIDAGGREQVQDVTLSTQDSVVDSAPNHDDLANAIGKQLAARIGESRFEMWFDHSDSVQVSRQHKFTVNINCDSPFASQRIQNSFGREIRTVVDRVCGPQYQVHFQIAESSSDAATDTSASNETISVSEPATNAENPTSSMTIPIAGSKNRAAGAKQKKGLSTFHFGTNNRLVEAGIEQSFQTPGRFSPLFVYGSTGCGKSHLLEAVTADFRSKLRKPRCVYLSAEQFTGLFLHSLRGGSGLPVFRRKYRDLDLLAIDDVQFFEGKRATLGEFQYTVDHLIRTGKQVIVSSDRPPVELHGFGNELSARLTAGLVCPLDYPDIETRKRIAKRMCSDRSFSLGDEVIEMICDSLSRDVRRISGAINRLHALTAATGETVSVEMARETLSDLFSFAGSSNTSMPNIEKAVCDFFDVKPVDLKSSSRRKRISSARMLAMYLSRQHTTSAFSEIGDYYGGRTHSTVIAAQRKVTCWLESNEGISLSHAKYPAREILKRIESNLRIG